MSGSKLKMTSNNRRCISLFTRNKGKYGSCICAMDDEIVPSTFNSQGQAYVYRLVCQIYCKSAEKRYLRKEKIKKQKKKRLSSKNMQANGIEKDMNITFLTIYNI